MPSPSQEPTLVERLFRPLTGTAIIVVVMTTVLGIRALQEGPPRAPLVAAALLLGVALGAVLFQVLARLRLRAPQGARWVDVVAIVAVGLVVVGFWVGWEQVANADGAASLSTLGTLWGIAVESVRSAVGAELRDSIAE